MIVKTSGAKTLVFRCKNNVRNLSFDNYLFLRLHNCLKSHAIYGIISILILL